MKYFDKYKSNTCAGSGNQLPFSTGGEIITGRIFYKLFSGGKYEYSFLFSNIIDSTFADGTLSHKNLICSSWEILSIRAGVVKSEFSDSVEEKISDEKMLSLSAMQELAFLGNKTKTVAPGEFFATDGAVFEADKGDYMCIEISFKGDMIPYHEESILPAYRKCGDVWELNKKMPYLSMLGCDRPAELKIGYLGDSITQGIGRGIPFNSYGFWNSLVSEMLGEKYAYWNLGIGYGRANDAATDGAWLYRAKHNDVVVVCYGVNDIFRIQNAEQTKKDLAEIVDKLHDAGVKVIVQTVPPFDYEGEDLPRWREINRFIKEELSKKAEAVFDVVPILGESEENPHIARYDLHPDLTGCSKWAEALYPFLKENL